MQIDQVSSGHNFASANLVNMSDLLQGCWFGFGSDIGYLHAKQHVWKWSWYNSSAWGEPPSNDHLDQYGKNYNM